MNNKCPNFECLTVSGYDLPVLNLKIKIRKFLISLLVLFAACVFTNAQQSFTAVDDHATTGPMQKVRVNVLANDTLTCSNYEFDIVSVLNPTTQGTATAVSGGFIEFTPGMNCRGVGVEIYYSVTCNGIVKQAKLTVTVTLYNNPANVIDEDVDCYSVMPGNVGFNVVEKFTTTNAANQIIDGYSIPLVADLNGDGKPEIIAIGVSGTSASNEDVANSIRIFNGQTGALTLSYPLQTVAGATFTFSIRHAYHNSPGFMAIADVNNDGLSEIILATSGADAIVRAYKPVINASTRAITGLSVMWESDVMIKNGTFTSDNIDVRRYGNPMPYIADLNGDGIPEVIVYNKIFNARTGKLLMAYGGAASTPTASDISVKRMSIYESAEATTSATGVTNVRPYAYVGRRVSALGTTYQLPYLGVIAVVDIDNDGRQEIIAGSRIYKFNLVNPDGQSGNTYTTIEGPQTLVARNTVTYYINDGFTRVADVDGDGKLDVIMVTLTETSDDANGIIVVWDSETGAAKAITKFHTNGLYGLFSMPFIGDINDRLDGWDGIAYTKKLPEICFTSGVLYINNTSTSTSSNREDHSHIDKHPTSNIPSTYTRFDGTRSSSREGHVFALTYDASETSITNRLKLSWAMEHADNSDNTGITMFDFDNDGAMDLCYRDNSTIRVVSPKKGTNDYYGNGSSANALLFSTGVISGTGYEAAIVADVDFDGSADIVTTHSPSGTGTRWGEIRVFNYDHAYSKWAPCPPVWNQALYDPRQIREDMQINARPLPILTEFQKGGETIRPYNGAWIQQPIIREGADGFVPVVRYPNADLRDVQVTANGTTSVTIVLDIFNSGTATLTSTTPVSFYDGGTGGLPIESSAFITSRTLGIDIFPNERATVTINNITGNFRDHLIWVRVGANNTAFPASGFDDCDLSNNTLGGSDCPNLSYTVQASSNVLCGNSGVVTLKAVAGGVPYGTPTYQWYRDEVIIPGAVGQIYFAEDPGMYKCYVTEGPVCREFSSSVTLTIQYGTELPLPSLVTSPADGKLCIDGNVMLSVTNYASYSGASYIWVKDGMPFDTTSLHYISVPHAGIPAGQEEGAYRVFVSQSGCGTLSAIDSITKSNEQAIVPVISKTPADAVICGDNGSVMLQVTNLSDMTGATFQWYQDGVAITGETGYYHFATVAGSYAVIAQSANGCSALSNSVAVTKQTGNITQPAISREPASGMLCTGGSILLKVTNVTTGYNYIWYKAGETASVASGSYMYATSGGSYYVVAVDGSCTANSAIITITASPSVISKPEIESVSGTLNICTGGSVLLSLKAAIPGITGYQWYKNGSVITGATGTTCMATSAGNYSLKVSDADCFAFSDELELTAGGGNIDAAAIVSLTGVYDICTGGEIFLRLTTVYPGSPVYQWIKSDGSSIPEEIPGSNSTMLRVTDAGQYWIEVSLNGCTSVSSPVTITKNGSSGTIIKPVLVSIPASAEYCNGGVVHLYVSNASSYSNPVYTWFKGNEELPNTTPYINVNVPGDYFVAVSGGNCQSGSDTITVAAGSGNVTAPLIDMLPANGQICTNGAVVLRVTNAAAYTGATYQWYRDSVAIAGATNLLYTATVAGDYYIRVVTGNGTGCVALSAEKHVQSSPSSINPVVLNVWPEDGRIVGDAPVEITVTNAADYTGSTYYWWNMDANVTVASGVNMSSYNATVAPVTYRVFIDNGNCGVWSDEVFVTDEPCNVPLPVPVISGTPAADGGYHYLCLPNGSVLLTVTNTSDYVLPVYQWYKNNTTIDGETSPTLEITTQGANETSGYRVRIVDQGCDVNSNIYQVKTSTSTAAKPLISSNPSSNQLCGTNGSIVLTFTNSTAFTGTVQWLKGNSTIPGANQTTYIATSAGSYRVQVSEGTCAYFSNPIEITAGSGTIAKPVLSQYPAVTEICIGGSIRLTVSNASSYTNPTYWWYNDNAVVQSSPVPYYYATATGSYYVQVIDGSSCSSTSDPKALQLSTTTSIPVPAISSLPASPVICGDNGVVLLTQTTSYGTGATFQWYKDYDAIPGATHTTFSATDGGTYYVEVSLGSCLSAPSSPVTVTKNVGSSIALPQVLKEPAEIIGTNPATLIFNNISDYATPLTYYWYDSNQEVLLATNTPSYNVSVAGTYYLLVVSDGCARWSNPVTVTDASCTLTVPVLTVQPSSKEICGVNGSVLLQVSNRDIYTNVTWQWFKGTETVGTNSPSLEITGPNGGGTYKVKVTDNLGCYNYSLNEVITYNPGGNIALPQVDALPNTLELCGTQGSIMLRFTNMSAYSNPQYNWMLEDFEIPGATNPVFEVTAPGKYRLKVTDGGCMTLSPIKDITRVPGSIQRPLLSKLPESTTICINGHIRLSVTNASAYTSSPTYVWYNGFTSAIVQSSNSPVYLATAAGEYYVQVVEGLCSSVSAHETLTMGTSTVDKPVLTVYPGQPILCGDNGVVVMHIATAYPAGTTYQWYKNDAAITAANGGTGTIYTATDVGTYYVEVRTGNCLSKSDAVSVTSGSSNIVKPNVTVFPVDGRIVDNQSALLTLNNPGSFSSPHYYWFKGDYNKFNTTATVVASGTGSGLQQHTTNEVGDYRLLVVDGTCASWSDLIQITNEDDCPNPAPVIEAVGGITDICGSDGKVLLQVANRNAYTTPVYQWIRDNSPIIGANSPTLELGALDSGAYQVTVTEGCLTISNTIQINVSGGTSTPKPAVAKNPANGVICGANGSVLLSFTNRSAFSDNITYEWYRNNYPVVSGSTTTGLTYPATEAGKYRIALISGGCLYLSDEIDVAFTPGSFAKPVMTALPDETEICIGGSIRLDVLNRNSYPVTAVCNWYKDDAYAGSGDYYMATAAGVYFVQVVDGTCSGTSDKKVLTMSTSTIGAPVISVLPPGRNICGDDAVVVLRLTNANLFTGASYQWYKNGTAITGATNAVYSATESGTYYLQIILGTCSVSTTPETVTKTSGATTLPAPNVTMFPADGEIPNGGFVRLSFNNYAAYSGAATWYWFKGENEIVATNATYYDASEAGRYRLLIVDGDCSRWSGWFELYTGCTDISKPTVSKVPTSATYVCTPNGSMLLKVSNTGSYNDPHYQWFKDDILQTGETSSVYEVKLGGSYKVRVTDEECNNYSDPVVINDNPAPGLNKPLISRNPATGSICGANSSVMLTFTNASLFTAYSHQWYKNNEPITSNGTGLIYEATEGGNYRIVVWDAACMAMSEEITINAEGGAITKPVLSKMPSSGYICQNGSVRFTVTNASAYTSPQYIWYKGEAEVAVTSVPEYVANSTGTYFVQVINSGGCSSTSTRETLISGGSIAVPVLNVYPSTALLCETNGTVALRLMNSYQDATYQWYRNDVAMTGETLPVLLASQPGNYYLEITTPDCSAVSQVINITVESPCVITKPVIAATPGDAKIVGGNPVILELQNKIYTASAKYYWIFEDGTIVAEDSQLFISTVIPGWYKLMVVDAGHAVISNEINVTESTCILNTLPQLSVLPASLTICGDNGSVYMTLLNRSAYSATATFQWYDGNTMLTGATLPYYTATTPGYYRLRVIDLQGIEYCVGDSPVYHVTKTGAGTAGIAIPDLRMTPSSGYLCQNGNIILYVYNRGAYNQSTVTYRWYKDGFLIPSATSNTYEVTSLNQTENEAEYMVQVIDADCGAIVSEGLIVRKSANTAITPLIEASGSTVCGINGSVLLRCTNIDDFGTGMKYYQWFYNNELLSGATSSTHEATLGGSYRLQVVSGICGSFSDPIELTGSSSEIPKPLTATLPVNGQICGANGSVYIYVTNTASYGSPVYQWYKNNDIIPGANESGYEVTVGQNGNYRVNITDGACSALSVNRNISASATEIALPVISSIPSSVTELCGVNGVLFLRLENPNDFNNPTYVWYKGESSIPGADQYYYIAESPGIYRLQVIENTCGAISNAINLTQGTTNITVPVIESESGSTEICGTESGVMLNVTTAYTGNVSYQWFKLVSGTPHIETGATSSHYYVKVPGDYMVLVTVDNCSAESNVINVTLNPTGTTAKPVLQSQGNITELCAGTSSMLLYVNNTTAYTSAATYVWYKGDEKVLSGVGLYSYIITAAGSYSVYVYEADGCGASSDTLTITQGTTPGITVPVIESESGSTEICGTESGVMLNITTAYTGNVSYQWYDTVIIQGATSSHYYATRPGDYKVLVTVDNCSAQSNVISVTFNTTGTTAKPVLKSQGDITSLCSGTSSVLLYVDNANAYTSAATYVWYAGDSTVSSGVGAYTYIATEVVSYSVYVYEADGCGAMSDTLTITQGPGTGVNAPVIESESGSTVICGAESGVMLKLITEYTGNVSYQWFNVEDNELITGATSSHYYTTRKGEYMLLVTVDNCSAESNVITVTVGTGNIAKPVLKSQGDLTELCDGTGSLLLYVDNANAYTSAATYVWYETDSDTKVLSGVGAHTYIVTATGSYSVYVYEADGCGSGSDTLTITQGTTPGITVPVIESESGSPVICGAESGVMLNLTTAYTGNVSYRWFKFNPLYNVYDIVTGATSSHYYTTVPGDYKVLVTVDNCSAESNVITVTLNPTGTTAKPDLKSQGDLTELCDGASSLLLYVDNISDYTSTATYVWYETGIDSVVLSGTGLYSYIVTATGSYSVYVYEADGCGAGSDTLTITQGTTPGITVPVIESESGSTEICGAESGVMLNIITAYTGNVSYQWYDTVIIPGATSSHYYTTQPGDYKVIVTVDNCSAQSNVISVTLNPTGTTAKPVLKSQGDLTELCDGMGSLLLYVDNANAYTSTATYVWYETESDTEVLSGVGLYTYIATSAGSYRVYVYESDGCGSGSDTLTISQGTTPGITVPVIVSESGSTEICGTESGVMLNITTAYTGNVSYQWYDTVIIQGATSSHYYATRPGDYKVIVTVDNCSATSNVINVTLNPTGTTAKPELKSQDEITELCAGTGSLLLYVDNSNAYTSAATYVWYENDKDSVVLNGVGAYMYIATAAGSYSVYVYETDGCGASSDTLIITQGSGTGITKPVIESESGSAVICGPESGVMLILTTDYTGAGTNITYQWLRHDTLMTGANQTYYYATEPDDYKILVTVDNCSAESDAITVTYDAAGSMTAIDLRSTDNSNVICSGSSLVLYVANAADYGTDATYVWYESDTAVFSGVGASTYSVVSAGSYSVHVFKSDGCFSVSANTIAVDVVDSLTADGIYSSMGTELIYNESTDLTVQGLHGGIAPYVYTWYRKAESETVWTEVYSGDTNTLTTGSLTETTCYSVVVSSSNPLLTCNTFTDTICIEVSQVELSLEFVDDIYSICNSGTDSISIKITNSKPGYATNVLIEFNSEGSLPSVPAVLIDSIPGDSDTTMVIYLPENTGNSEQSGILKAEIISCDQNDANPDTHYGNWRDERNWADAPQEADEDALNLTVYPNLQLLSALDIAICSGTAFNYIPESNIQGTTFSWERLADGYFEYSAGTGAIDEILTNTLTDSIIAKYVFTLGADFCPSSITDTLTVVVYPKPVFTLSHTPADGIITLGTPVIIEAIPSNSNAVSSLQYGFSPVNTTIAPLIFVLVPRDTVREFNEGEINTVMVTVENEYGCRETGTESFTMTYNMPNVITPKASMNKKLLEGYDIQVFNRLGSELYHGTDGWDGTYKGAYVAAGTYFYVLRYKQGDKDMTLKHSVFVKY